MSFGMLTARSPSCRRRRGRTARCTSRWRWRCSRCCSARAARRRAEHNRGLVLAMAFESLFKLGAMLALGAFVWFGAGRCRRAPPLPTPAPTDASGFPAAGPARRAGDVHPAAPVPCRRGRMPRRAPRAHRALAVPAVHGADRAADPAAGACRRRAARRRWACRRTCTCWRCRCRRATTALALFAFLGGLSAATGMVILVSTLTLSLMIGNHWLAPVLVRGAWARGAATATCAARC